MDSPYPDPYSFRTPEGVEVPVSWAPAAALSMSLVATAPASTYVQPSSYTMQGRATQYPPRRDILATAGSQRDLVAQRSSSVPAAAEGQLGRATWQGESVLDRATQATKRDLVSRQPARPESVYGPQVGPSQEAGQYAHPVAPAVGEHRSRSRTRRPVPQSPAYSPSRYPPVVLQEDDYADVWRARDQGYHPVPSRHSSQEPAQGDSVMPPRPPSGRSRSSSSQSEQPSFRQCKRCGRANAPCQWGHPRGLYRLWGSGARVSGV